MKLSEKPGGGVKRKILRSGLFFCGLLIAVDLVLRIFGAGVPPKNFCSNGAPRGSYRYAPRNRYVDAPTDSSMHFIICFGDSWTYGLGVAAEQTWPAALEKLLGRRETQARVVNAAVCGATAAEVAKNFERQVKRYQARRVVLMVGAQDAMPLALLKKDPPGDPYKTQSCPQPWWRLGNLIARRYQAFQLRLHNPDPPDGKENIARRESITETQMQLMELARRAGDLNVTAVFVTYPVLPVGPHAAPFWPLEARNNFLIRAAAESFGHLICDLETRWGERTEKYLMDWMNWPHPNAAGHADIAQAVFEMLK